jgi:integral membrane sensor domain MASE1
MLAGHDPAYIRAVWLVASAIGALVLVALVVVYRRAVRRAEIEHAEQVIAEHDQVR